MTLFTIGYEKRQIESFIDLLQKNGVEILVDIRAVPHSRVKDFTGKNLDIELKEKGIDYLSVRDLGSPEVLRKKTRTDGDYDYFFREYGKYLATKIDCLKELADLAEKNIICLFCYEADFNRCHRRSVAERIAAMVRNPGVTHL